MIPVSVTQLAEESAQPAYTGGGLPKGWIMIVISVALYVLPTLLAWKRGSRRFRTIALVNLMLGWTILGWIAAMAMTYAYEPPAEGEIDVPHTPGQRP
ncbi:superinfection immunity protein [Gemmatimonas aurantiaca]|uniref:superinfection immunity protein n=1 Tax=Gemmatimonas aurantiaca TaxID=173480 RepID=UPI00301C2F8F